MVIWYYRAIANLNYVGRLSSSVVRERYLTETLLLTPVNRISNYNATIDYWEIKKWHKTHFSLLCLLLGNWFNYHMSYDKICAWPTFYGYAFWTNVRLNIRRRRIKPNELAINNNNNNHNLLKFQWLTKIIQKNWN